MRRDCADAGSAVLRAFCPHRRSENCTRELFREIIRLERRDEILFRQYPVIHGQRVLGEFIPEKFVGVLPDHRFGNTGREGFWLFD